MKRYEAYKDSGIEWIGEIPEGWRVSKLKYNTDIVMGQSPNGDSVLDTGVLPFMQGNAEFGTRFPAASKFCDCPNKCSRIGDILMSVRAPVGALNISDRVYGIGRGLCSIKAEGINRDYLFFFLHNSVEAMRALSDGSTFEAITVQNLSNLSMCVPSLSEQQAIASYLDYKVGQIDKSISQIDSQIDSLKAYRQSVISEAVTKGLDKNAKMKYSGIEWIGEIPEGWNVIPMKHYFYMKGRIGWQGLKADEFLEEGPFLVTGTDFKNGRVNWNTCYHITEERYQEAPEIHVHEGDVLITKDGTIGKLAYIEDKPEKVSLNSHLLILRPTKDVVNNYFVFWSLQSSAFKDYSGLASSGSTMASLSQEKIGSYFMALPPVDEQYVIAKYLENKMARIDEAINALYAQKSDLNALKQAIISEAVTGKKDLREWTPSVEQ